MKGSPFLLAALAIVALSDRVLVQKDSASRYNLTSML